MIIGGETSTGGRTANQDALLISRRDRLFVIADGAGGHNAGEVASGMVVEGIAKRLKEKPIPVPDGQFGMQGYFVELIQEMNEQVFEKSVSSPECYKMATTVVLVYIDESDGLSYVFHVGDSRAYLIRDGEIMQITEDHTYVNELLKRGQVSKEEALEHPRRHMITRAIGGQATVKVDVHQIRYSTDDIFVLCTDGLSNEVADEEIRQIVTAAADDMQLAAIQLIKAANDRQCTDNITAICVKL